MKVLDPDTVDFQSLDNIININDICSCYILLGLFHAQSSKKQQQILFQKKTIYTYSKSYKVLLIGRIWLTRSHQTFPKEAAWTNNSSWQNKNYKKGQFTLRHCLAFFSTTLWPYVFILLFCIAVHTVGVYLVKMSGPSVTLFWRENTIHWGKYRQK